MNRLTRALIPLARRFASAAVVCMLGVSASSGQVLLSEPPEELDGIGVEERLGESVPADIPLFTAEGESVLFGSYFAQDSDDKRPIVLMMVYYDCPLLCGMVMERAHEAFNKLSYQIGEDYKVVVVSFDHTNTPAMAMGQQTGYRARYFHAAEINADLEKKEAFEQSYVFHTASAGNARALADAIGFNYNFIPARNGGNGEFSHPAVLTVLTPEGVVSRYIEALTAEPRQVRLALLEASDGAIGDSIGDIFLHSCFVWDPDAGAYGLKAMRAMQLAGGLTAIGLGFFVGVMFLTDRLRARRRPPGNSDEDAAVSRPTDTISTGSIPSGSRSSADELMNARPASPAHA